VPIIIIIRKKVWIIATKCRLGLVRRLIDPRIKVKWDHGKLSITCWRISKFVKLTTRNLRIKQIIIGRLRTQRWGVGVVWKVYKLDWRYLEES
jgi:hypothetical protein